MTWGVANNTAVRRSMPLPTEHAPRQAMGFREWPFRSASSHPALREVSAGCEEVFEPRLLGDPLGVPHRTAAGIGGLGCLYDTRSWRLIGLVVSSAGSSLTSTRSIAVGSHCRSHSWRHNRDALDVPQRLTLSPLFVVRSCRWIRVDRLWPLACASWAMRPYAHAPSVSFGGKVPLPLLNHAHHGQQQVASRDRPRHPWRASYCGAHRWSIRTFCSGRCRCLR